MRKIMVALLLLACAACGGGSSDPIGLADSRPERSEGSAKRGTVSSSTTTAASDAPRSSGSRSTGSPIALSPGARPTIAPHKRLPLKVDVSRSCARRGDTVEVTATTVPGAQVGFTVDYPGGKNEYVPDFHWVPKDANVTGTAVWSLVLRPDTPFGPGNLTVLVSKSPKSNVWQGSFTVARAC